MSFQFCLFSPVVVWAMCFGGISSVLPFPVLAFFLLPPLFRISLSGYLIWIVSQRYLSCLSCLQGHSLWVHNQIFTFWYANKTAGNIELRRCLCTTSVFASTPNVGINASCCISLFCIYVLYCIFSAFCKISAIRYNALSDREFSHRCYRIFVESKDCGFLGISLVSLCFLCECCTSKSRHWKVEKR